MKSYSYVPRGVCAKQIFFSLDEGKIHNLYFEGGCPGNLQAISRLLEGGEAQKAINLLKGNTCGNKNTSCADQLAQALEAALAEDHG
ncbi:MAG: TIGR03905 family TSCPD domain-containing protein [Desulfovibrio sp.]|nr:TIGR03905 family TSCPD domain-containing protein [Desulfovibrio sp.]